MTDEEGQAMLALARHEGYVIYRFSKGTWTWIKGDPDGTHHETSAEYGNEVHAGAEAWSNHEVSNEVGYCVCCKCMNQRDRDSHD